MGARELKRTVFLGNSLALELFKPSPDIFLSPLPMYFPEKLDKS